jgi:hypothetical protein
MPSRRALFIAPLACCLLPACGPLPSSTGAVQSIASATASPPGGEPLTAAKFTTVVPHGWSNKINDSAEVQKFSGNGTVELLVEQAAAGQVQQGVNDVTANVNVVLLNTPVPDDQVATYLQGVTSAGATNLSAPRPFTIAGATGQYITYDRDIQGTPGESRDMIVNHAGATFEIVFSTSQFAFAGQESGLQDVLAGWRWS